MILSKYVASYGLVQKSGYLNRASVCQDKGGVLKGMCSDIFLFE